MGQRADIWTDAGLDHGRLAWIMATTALRAFASAAGFNIPTTLATSVSLAVNSFPGRI
jgi:hypothetical protein